MAGKLLIPKIISADPCEGELVCGTETVGSIGKIACGFEKKSPRVIFDFGRKVTGYLQIKVGSHSKDSFVIRYGPVSDCLHLSQRIPMPQSGEYLGDYYIACRYLCLYIDSDSIQANDVYANGVEVSLISSQYPVSYVGSFTCEDEALNTVWRRSAYTLELNMQKYRESCRFRMNPFDERIGAFSAAWKGPWGNYVLMDGPRRDREVWLGDVRAEALGVYTSFAAYDVCKSSLALFGDLAGNDGLTVGSGSTWQGFTEYNYWGIVAVWECYLYTGDRSFLEHALPFVRNILAYTDSRVDERGFISNNASWMWTIPREGCNAGTQAILYFALECAAKIERVFHFEKEAARWETLREKIKKNLNLTFWNEEKGVYEEAIRLVADELPVLLDINVYAVLFGIADKEQSGRILSYIREHMWTPYGSATMDKKITNAHLDPALRCYPLIRAVHSAPDPVAELERFMWAHNRKVWPFINAYEVQARFVSGDTEGALQLIRNCWVQPYFDETDTYWEIVDPENLVFNSNTCYYIPKDDCYNSAAHGWSGWVGYLMQTYVLGVMPLSAGFAKARISPQTGTLRNVCGEVPTPHGVISVSIVKTETEYRVSVTKPCDVEVEVCLQEADVAGRRAMIEISDC